MFLRFVPRFALETPLLLPLPFAACVLPALAAAAAAPARCASSRLVSSWWACESRKRPLAAELAATDADVRYDDDWLPLVELLLFSRAYAPDVTALMLKGDEAWVWWELERTPVMAERVLGVMVPDTPPKVGGPLLFIMARKAAVLGEGGGKDTGPPMSGVRPVPGVRPLRGVRPVRKAAGSKAARGCSFCCWGAVSMAGLSGPDLSELESEADEKAHE